MNQQDEKQYLQENAQWEMERWSKELLNRGGYAELVEFCGEKRAKAIAQEVRR